MPGPGVARILKRQMQILFVHNNFPAQFRHVAEHLHRRGSHRLAAIGADFSTPLTGVDLRRYQAPGRSRPFMRSLGVSNPSAAAPKR